MATAQPTVTVGAAPTVQQKLAAKPRVLHVWTKERAPADERYVDIQYVSGDQTVWVSRSFPMSLLILYSKKAKAELPGLAKATPHGSITWSLKPHVADGSLDLRGLLIVLKWIRFHLDARGYSPTYQGHPQLPATMIAPSPEEAEFDVLIRVIEAAKLLDLAAPLDEQRVVPAMLRAFVDQYGYTSSQLELLHMVLPSHHVTAHALHVLVDYLDDPATPEEEHKAYQDLRTRLSTLHTAITAIEMKKARRLAKEERQRKHEQWLERKARRSAWEAKNREKVVVAKQKVDEAAQGERVLKDEEARKLMCH